MNIGETKRNKGITLIALAVTIIIIIILAGVTISQITGDEGILSKSRKEQENITGMVNTTEDTIRKLENKLADGEVSGEEDRIKIVTSAKGTTSTITIDVVAYNPVGYKMKYEIKIYPKGDPEHPITLPSTVSPKENVPNGGKETFIIEDLPYEIPDGEDGEYEYEVTVILEDGKEETTDRKEETTDRIPVSLEKVAKAEGASISPTYWTNENVTLTLPINDNYKTYYQIEAGTETEYNKDNKPEISSNGTIKYYYKDEPNKGEESTIEVKNIDKVDPEIKTALNKENIKTNGFTLTIGVQDSLSGIAKIEWYYKKTTDSEYTKVEDELMPIHSESTGITTETTRTRKITDLGSGTYTVYAKVYDVAGNSKESGRITVETETVPPPTGARITPAYWTNGNVTVTLPSNTDFTTQHKENSITEPWTDGTSVTMTANGVVNYRFTDGTNYSTNYKTCNVINIDKVEPIVNPLQKSNVSTSGFTLSVKVRDSLSGLSTIKWYYKLSSASSYSCVTTDSTNDSDCKALNGSTAGTTTAVTKTKALTGLTNGTYSCYAEVYDVAGNKKRTPASGTIDVEVYTAGVYAKLYDTNSDGTGETLVFGSKSNFTYTGTLKTNYGDVSNLTSDPSWIANTDTTKADFVDTVSPQSTYEWFDELSNLTTINNISRLNTSNVTNMYMMFCNCEKLTSIDVSNFNTSNVTNMIRVFY